jgi:hypothetical protein
MNGWSITYTPPTRLTTKKLSDEFGQPYNVPRICDPVKRTRLMHTHYATTNSVLLLERYVVLQQRFRDSSCLIQHDASHYLPSMPHTVTSYSSDQRKSTQCSGKFALLTHFVISDVYGDLNTFT